MIIAGDLNVVRFEIDLYMAAGRDLNTHKMPSCRKVERENMEIFLKQGWIDTFREIHPTKVQYTWWNPKIDAKLRNIGWRIDYILVNGEMINTVK